MSESCYARRSFISDLGSVPEELQVRFSSSPITFGRYAVFVPLPNQDGHQIVEVSQDIEYLKRKYSVSDDWVLNVSAPSTDERD